VFGSTFWKIGLNRTTQNNIFNIAGALYAATLFLGVSNSSSVQPVTSIQRAVFYRERSAGMFGVVPFALAQFTMELPYVLVQVVLYASITYSMIHFEWTAAKFFWYMLFVFLTQMYFTFYGIMAIALTPALQVAAVVSSTFYSIWNLFSGFLIPQVSMPRWWFWYTYINPVYWTLYGLIGSQLGDVTNQQLTLSTGGTETVSAFINSYFGYRHDFIGAAAGILCGFIITFGLVVILALRFLNFNKR